MRRTLAIAAVIVLVVAVEASAGSRTYRGTIEGDEPSSISLLVKRSDGQRQVKGFAAKRFLIACDNGPATLARAAISGVIAVNSKGRFEINGSDGGQELRVAGKLIGKRGAEGTMRYSGPTLVDGQTRECDSRKLRWTAAR